MRKLKGTIVSATMQKTVVVRVDSLRTHPKYQKRYRASRTFKAHDAGQEYHEGDVVMIEETRPLSGEKRWRVAALVKGLPDTAHEPAGSESGAAPAD